MGKRPKRSAVDKDVAQSTKANRSDVAGTQSAAPALERTTDVELQIRLLEAQANLVKENVKLAKENVKLAKENVNLEKEKRLNMELNDPRAAIVGSLKQAADLHKDAATSHKDSATSHRDAATSYKDGALLQKDAADASKSILKEAEEQQEIRKSLVEIIKPKKLDLDALQNQSSPHASRPNYVEITAAAYLKLAGIDVDQYSGAAPLAAKIPITEAVFVKICKADSLAEDVFRVSVPNERETFDDLAEMALKWRDAKAAKIAEHQTEGGKREDEDTVPSFWAPFVNAMNRLCALSRWPNAVRTCPQSWETSDMWFMKKSKQPDIAIFFQDLLVCVGEFKSSKVGIQEGLTQCRDYVSGGRWLPLCMGRMPFVLVLSITGLEFSVAVLKCPGSAPTKIPIPLPTDALTITIDRRKKESFIKVIHLAIDVLRICRFVGERAVKDRDETLCAVQYMSRPKCSSYFQLCGINNVFFRWENGSAPYVEKWFKTKPRIYDVAKQPRVIKNWPASLICPLQEDDPRNDITTILSPSDEFEKCVRLSPIGCHRAAMPQTVECIFRLLRDVYQALEFLHNLHFCHCDIARRNIVRRCMRTSGYLLIDIDSSRQFKAGCGIKLPECQLQRVFSDNGIYRPCDDVSQFLFVVREVAQCLPQAEKDRNEGFLKHLAEDITNVRDEIGCTPNGINLVTAKDLHIGSDYRIHLNIPTCKSSPSGALGFVATVAKTSVKKSAEKSAQSSPQKKKASARKKGGR